jgi:hypothetical protein
MRSKVNRNLRPRRELRPRIWRRQRDVLCDVLLSAGQCETWLTLHELARLTGYGEASVSAQLRHLRKPEYGGFVVEKRQRAADEIVRDALGPVWEYQLRRGVRMIRTPAGARKKARSEVVKRRRGERRRRK